jgi:hypothetical protein
VVALLAIRGVFRSSGGYLVLAGFAIIGFAWVEWLRLALVVAPPAGSLINYFFAIGIVVVGLGGARWRLGEASGVRSRRAPPGAAECAWNAVWLKRADRPASGPDELSAILSPLFC